MRKHLYLAMLLMAGLPAGSFTAAAAPEPQQKSQTVATIVGTVYDENDEPVIGASVVQQGVKTNAVATDAFGNFKIRVAPGTKLVVTYVGYKPQTVTAAPDMSVYMQPTTESLEQLVVVGYGTQKRANLTGAVATVDVARVMDGRSTADVTKALQGAVPGLTITNSDGGINSTASIKIRGTGTLSNGQASAPLIVVDGVVSEDISFLNPDDIAEISVLKDAASASIYGTRAAFGVVLITTKNPSTQDRVSVKYSNNIGFSQATTLPSYPSVYSQVHALTEGNLMSNGELGLFGMDPFVMMPLAQQWAKDHNNKPSGYREMVPWTSDNSIGDYKIMPDGTGIYYADWDVAGIMFNNAAPSNYHNVSLEGTSGKTQYRVAFGYSNKQDVMKFNPAHMRRYNATANLSTEIFSWLKAGVRFSFSEKDFTGPYNVRGDYQYMWRWGSYFGPYGYSLDDEGNIVDYRNDIAYRKQAGDIKDSATQTRMTAFFDATPFKGFTLHGDFTYDVMNILQTRAYMPVYGYNSWGAITAPEYIVPVSYADARQTNTKQDMWSMNVFGSYAHTFAQDFNFKIMLGATAEQQDYNNLYAKRDILLDLTKPWLGLTTGGANKTGYEITNTITKRATAGFFGRINFDYKGIYLLELNGRYDGSSRFPANDQWAFFGSGSIGYRFSEEAYFKPLKAWWSNGKLRASYGSVGNEAVGDYRFLSTISGPSNAYWLTSGGASQQYAGMPSLVSRTLTWEKVVTTDVGIDLGFLNNSLTASFDWYNRETRNMLGPGASLPSVLGAATPYGNNGTLTTKGWELALGWNHSFGDAQIYVTGTLADARTKVTQWYNENGTLYSWKPVQNDYTEGSYFGDIYGFETERYFTADDFYADGTCKYDQSALESGSFRYSAGDVKFRDLNGDGVINFGNPNMIELDGKIYIPGDAGYEAALADKNHKEVPVGTKRNHGDLKVIGNTQPRFEYGFRIGGAWKGFDLDMFFQGVGKRDMWAVSAFVMPFARGTDALYSNQMSYNYYDINMDTKTLGEIHVDQSHDYPRLYPGGDGEGRFNGLNNGRYNFYPQSRYLMNTAYLRFKNLTVGYTIPAEITQKALIQKARIYFSADNLCLLYNGMRKYPLDPEMNVGTNGTTLTSSGIFAGNGYYGRTTPISRTFSFGCQVTF
ncbi:MAG: TonB-dependent receptor [Muribaculaceae bacterium]|nr:TonB-dependent receptor [Muribaculaceae bacterium]